MTRILIATLISFLAAASSYAATYRMDFSFSFSGVAQFNDPTAVGSITYTADSAGTIPLSFLDIDFTLNGITYGDASILQAQPAVWSPPDGSQGFFIGTSDAGDLTNLTEPGDFYLFYREPVSSGCCSLTQSVSGRYTILLSNRR